ncbi:NMDA receptor-regulated protein 1-domain-containing protein [Pyronema omphalodes]|nr:NMDA receptor-regulated protein 1-domain-containing protein [Pyronema omphalodes]
MPTTQPLASKDLALFRQIIKCYEQKQYKKGLKSCEQLLKKVPKHGETLAMKGLIINSMGRTEEAFAVAKEALRYDMKSHVCWHVYGLIHRSQKNYQESIKAYKMALRFEPESQQILRDLCLLQIHMRNYEGYVETRKTILQTRPNLRSNWTAVAIGEHLAGHYAAAEKVLNSYEETLKDLVIPKGDIEHWEAALYKNRIIADSGDYERALEHLQSIRKNVLEKVALLEYRAEYLLKLGRMEDAEQAYRVLLDRNPEKRDYYDGLEQAIGVKPENRKEAMAIYEEYAEKYPRADAPRRVPLDFLDGDDFRKAADTYLKAKLEKGVPSTFANIKALYGDEAKRATIFELVSSYHEAQEKEAAEANGAAPSKLRLWSIYFLAQHYDHYRTRDMEKALALLNKGLELSPKTLEYHMTIARVYKHAGDFAAAAKKMDEARSLDKSDRYINTKTAKYQLRNDQNEDALKTMSLFTRNEANGGPFGDLLEMQCIWYLTEDAESYLRQNQLGLTLKRYQYLWDIFEVWAEDQFDFHSFSLRKGMIRAYVDMLKWEDVLRAHPMFLRAALGAIQAYIKIADYPVLGQGSMSNDDAAKYESMTEAERKKAIKKAKKEAQKAQERQAALAAAKKEEKNKNAQVAEGEEKKKEDLDPHGIALAATKTPLEEAFRWLKPLLAFSPERLESQLAGFEVQLRRRQWFAALECLTKAKELAPEDPKIHEMTVRFRQAVNTLPEDEAFKAPETKEALLEGAEKVLAKDTDLIKFNDDFLDANKSSVTHICAALRARKALKPEEKDASVLISALDTDITLTEAVEGLRLLGDLQIDEAAYREKATAKFPLAKVFKALK